MAEDKRFKLFQELHQMFPEAEITDQDQVEACLQHILKRGFINLDFIDEDNWDRIERYELDRNNNLLYLFYHEPASGHASNLYTATCALVLSLQCIEIIHDKTYGPIAVAIKGRNVQSKALNSLMRANGYTILSVDSRTEFFADDVVREKNGVREYIRFLNTPIISFWIIDKSLYVNPNDSLKILYNYNLHQLERRANCVETDLKAIQQASYTADIFEDKICAAGNTLRRIAESFFKLMVTYHIDKVKLWDKFKCEDYNKYYLGDLEKLLTSFVFCDDDDKTRIRSIVDDANELSHDTGHPVEMATARRLLSNIRHYFCTFIEQVKNNERNKLSLEEVVAKKPSPESFIIQNWQSWDFQDLLSTGTLNPNAKIAYSISIDIGLMHSPFDLSKSVGCDGKIFEHDLLDKEDQFLFGSRVEAIKACDAINQRVKNLCEKQGLDTDAVPLYFSATIERRRIQYPTKLFTVNDIRTLLQNADTSQDNCLVVDEDGNSSLMSDRKLAKLYPVRAPWWKKGDTEIGKSVSEDVVESAYYKALHQWYLYITCDLDVTDIENYCFDIEEKIKTIKELCNI